MFRNSKLNKHYTYITKGDEKFGVLTVTDFSFDIDTFEEVLCPVRVLVLKNCDFVSCVASIQARIIKAIRKCKTLQEIQIVGNKSNRDTGFIEALFESLYTESNVEKLQYESVDGDRGGLAKQLRLLLSQNTRLKSLTISGAFFNDESYITSIKNCILAHDHLSSFSIIIHLGEEKKCVLNNNYKGQHPDCLAIVERLIRNSDLQTNELYLQKLKEKDYSASAVTALNIILHSTHLSSQQKYKAFTQTYQELFRSNIPLITVVPSYSPLVAYVYSLLTLERGFLNQTLTFEANELPMSAEEVVHRLEKHFAESSGDGFAYHYLFLLLKIKIDGLPTISPDLTYAQKLLFKQDYLHHDKIQEESTPELLDMIRNMSLTSVDSVTKGRLVTIFAPMMYRHADKKTTKISAAFQAINQFERAIDAGFLPAKFNLREFFHQLASSLPWAEWPLEYFTTANYFGFHEFKLFLIRDPSIRDMQDNAAILRACILQAMREIEKLKTHSNNKLYLSSLSMLAEWTKGILVQEWRALTTPLLDEALTSLTTMGSEYVEDVTFGDTGGITTHSLFTILLYVFRANQSHSSSLYLKDAVKERICNGWSAYSASNRINLNSTSEISVLLWSAYRKKGSDRKILLERCQKLLDSTEESEQKNEVKSHLALFNDDADSKTSYNKLMDKRNIRLLPNIYIITSGFLRDTDTLTAEWILRLSNSRNLDHFATLALFGDEQGILVMNTLYSYMSQVIKFVDASKDRKQWSIPLARLYCYLGVAVTSAKLSDIFALAPNELINEIMDEYVKISKSDTVTQMSPLHLKQAYERFITEFQNDLSDSCPQLVAMKEFVNSKLDIADEPLIAADALALTQYLNDSNKQSPTAPPQTQSTVMLANEARPTPSAPPPGTKTSIIWADEMAHAEATVQRPKTMSAPQPAFDIPYAELKFNKKIAQGGQGDVYQGEWNSTEVAVKVMRSVATEKSRQSFYSECAILTKLRHPNVVSYLGYSSSEEKQSFCIVMEYCSNGAFSDYIHAKDQWNNPLAWRIRCASEVSLGLAYLHSKQVLHLDIKSANVFITATWQARLGDFGIAKSLQTLQSQQTTYNLKGTPSHLAPELFSQTGGAVVHTEANDVYSFGIFLWSALAEELPFANLQPFQLMYQVAMGARPEIPAETPPKLSALLQNCWLQEAAKRPSAKQVAEVLQEISAEMSSKSDDLRPGKR